ncbi:hypothetical protein QL285_012607 [Trifolium repens]|nr:hypothetical protein QL285_012607 [Trifolium repens]
MSITPKSIENMNLLTLTRTSSTISDGCVMDLSASCNVILVRVISRPQILSISDNGIRLMFGPKSMRAVVASVGNDVNASLNVVALSMEVEQTWLEMKELNT